MMYKMTLAVALTLGSFASLARAAEYIWTGEKDANWNTAANWRPDTGTPGKDDDAAITGLKGNSTISLSKDIALRSLTFDPQALYTCTLENHSLTLSDGAEVTFRKLPGDVGMGKDASQTIASDVKLSGGVRLSNMNRWYLGGERLSIRGRISGNGSITIGGVRSGVVRFLGDNTDYKGSIIIESGALLISYDAALGSGKDPIRLDGGSLTIGARVSTARDILVTTDASWDSHGPNGTHDGTITINPGATWRVRNGGGNTMTVRGVVRGEGNLTFAAHGTTFAGTKANTLSGTVTVGGIRGATILARDNGVNVVAGPLVMADMGTLRWDADEQIADHSPITFAGKLPTLALNGHNETLGTLDLQSDGRIDLGLTAGRLAFADSSTQAWDLDRVLLVINGGKRRGVVRFGNSDEALTPEQLMRIGFVDPAGYAPGTYTARLTADGELAPSGELVRPIDLPIDQSDKALTRRRALYDVPGMARLGGTETPLQQGMTISVFGDSITWGGGYIRLLQQALKDAEGSKTLGIKVINHGVNGGGVLTIRDGEESTNHAGKTKSLPFSQTIATEKADVAVIYIGVNDVWWRKTSPEVFEQALRDLVTQAKANKTVPVLATLTVMKEAVGNWNPKCDVYAEITRKVARETGTTLVDLRAGFVACLENESITVRPGGTWTSNGRLLNHDGIHANGRGDRLLADLIAQGIYEALRN